MSATQFMDIVILHELAHYDGTIGNPDVGSNEVQLWNGLRCRGAIDDFVAAANSQGLQNGAECDPAAAKMDVVNRTRLCCRQAATANAVAKCVFPVPVSLRAFQRDTSADTMCAILREDPPDLPESVSPALAQIVRRCVEKEPSQRFQSAADLAFALRALSSGITTSSPAAAAPPAIRRNWIPYAVVAAAAGLVGAGAVWLFRPAPEIPLYRFTPLTSFTGMEQQPALSADGKQLAFAWLGEPPDLQGVYVKLVAEGAQPLRISPTGKASGYPAWSPDGTRVAYVRPGGDGTDILVTPALGGPERRIAHYPGGAMCRNQPVPARETRPSNTEGRSRGGLG